MCGAHAAAWHAASSVQVQSVRYSEEIGVSEGERCNQINVTSNDGGIEIFVILNRGKKGFGQPRCRKMCVRKFLLKYQMHET
ncbi:hypothetical protein CEXT_98441 [Caerostris extrusa]|uniref:Uncharacterized protein n=1 Tax=Caerostris extrusa TaxID=172846 RepID=A0AAV4RZI6_CAEEX|nr:hypothetical protein CEXT_98441 [Caerostris extrusa]